MHPKYCLLQALLLILNPPKGGDAFPFRAIVQSKNRESRNYQLYLQHRPIMDSRQSSLQPLAAEPTTSPGTSDRHAENDSLPFDEKSLEAYKSVILEVMESPRVRKKAKPDTTRAARDFLLSRTTLPSLPCPFEDSDGFRSKMREQKGIFNQHYDLTEAQYDFAMRCLVYMGDACARRRNALPIVVAWHKMKESGIIPRENGISTYMYVLSIDEAYNDALVEVATCHDNLFPPNEKTVTLRIKSLIIKNDIEGAEAALASLPDKGEGGEWKRLRTCLPLMEHYCTVGDASSILRLFRTMRQSSGVIFDPESYALIVGSLARYKYFCVNGKPIEGANEAGFSSTHGPELLDGIVEEMAEDILELSETAAQTITNAFLKGFTAANVNNADSGDIPILSKGVSSSGLSIGRVDIDAATALCPITGSKLRLFALDEEQRRHVHDTLLDMARLSYQDFTKKQKNKGEEDENYGFEELLNFSKWLNTREGDPFTVIVDGPNVAYFGYPQLHYSQLEQVVEKLEEMGEKPLVVMPKKYAARSFRLTHNDKIQTLDDKAFNVIESLLDQGEMYTVPARCLDDYYWMLASVSNQTCARQLTDFGVSNTDEGDRFPGLRPVLVTNDKMRDHKMDLLKPREFRRWCSCHIVNYSISACEGDDEWDPRQIRFFPADFFSREIQGNLHSNGKGKVWHFPVAEWSESTTRFCIWIDQ